MWIPGHCSTPPIVIRFILITLYQQCKSKRNYFIKITYAVGRANVEFVAAQRVRIATTVVLEYMAGDDQWELVRL